VSKENSTLPWHSPEFYRQAHAVAAKYVEFVEHKGKRILVTDCAGADLQLLRAIAAECLHIVSSQGLTSMRTLVDVEGAEFDTESMKIASELAAKNRPYVLRSAVVGVKGLRFFAFKTIIAATQRPMRLFEDRQRALDWLAEDDVAK
jgi:hypothetical protein